MAIAPRILICPTSSLALFRERLAEPLPTSKIIKAANQKAGCHGTDGGNYCSECWKKLASSGGCSLTKKWKRQKIRWNLHIREEVA